MEWNGIAEWVSGGGVYGNWNLEWNGIAEWVPQGGGIGLLEFGIELDTRGCSVHTHWHNVSGLPCLLL